ncbi:hypothetical protein AArcSl_1074 [Halalkaliarchaeum desulfuricum]|uniref:Uncharacterized protein n=1 Tax=Halalkaliarchaeum desulfuricum TaxID=2055893 RepID=A0A343THY7_9EURY|nr:hypothetical protein [Halalkaliarchaeum desulfuricum]AUX08709.1 hypothetical protein AArcSl_1074 [Halalkaliarchaeum desulfuricum]
MSGSVARSKPWSGSFGGDRLRDLLRTIAFVAAVALPAVYVPVLFAGGIGPLTPSLGLALLALHVLALVAGH